MADKTALKMMREMGISCELPPISWTQEMGGPFMAGNALCGVALRLRAAELYDGGKAAHRLRPYSGYRRKPRENG